MCEERNGGCVGYVSVLPSHHHPHPTGGHAPVTSSLTKEGRAPGTAGGSVRGPGKSGIIEMRGERERSSNKGGKGV